MPLKLDPLNPLFRLILFEKCGSFPIAMMYFRLLALFLSVFWNRVLVETIFFMTNYVICCIPASVVIGYKHCALTCRWFADAIECFIWREDFAYNIWWTEASSREASPKGCSSFIFSISSRSVLVWETKNDGKHPYAWTSYHLFELIEIELTLEILRLNIPLLRFQNSSGVFWNCSGLGRR